MCNVAQQQRAVKFERSRLWKPNKNKFEDGTIRGHETSINQQHKRKLHQTKLQNNKHPMMSEQEQNTEHKNGHEIIKDVTVQEQ